MANLQAHDLALVCRAVNLPYYNITWRDILPKTKSGLGVFPNALVPDLLNQWEFEYLRKHCQYALYADAPLAQPYAGRGIRNVEEFNDALEKDAFFMATGMSELARQAAASKAAQRSSSEAEAPPPVAPTIDLRTGQVRTGVLIQPRTGVLIQPASEPTITAGELQRLRERFGAESVVDAGQSTLPLPEGNGTVGPAKKAWTLGRIVAWGAGGALLATGGYLLATKVLIKKKKKRRRSRR